MHYRLAGSTRVLRALTLSLSLPYRGGGNPTARSEFYN